MLLFGEDSTGNLPRLVDGLNQKLIATAVIVGVAALAYWLVTAGGRRFVRQMAKRAPDAGARAETLWVVLRRVLAFTIILIAVLMGFGVWGLSMAPFVAVGTVVAAAVGFGAQTFVRDLIAGFFILSEDQFHVGDTVTIAGTTGTVEDVLMRVTVLRDIEGNVHYVPNGQIGVTTNYTSQYSQPVIDVQVAYRVDVERALAVMHEELVAMTEDPAWSSKMRGVPEVMGIDRMTRETVTLRARLTTVPADRWAVRREAYRRIKARFAADGIQV